MRAMDGCESVFHLAAAVGAPGPEAHELNVGGTARVVDAVRRAGVRRLVHTSTSAAICVPDPDGPGCVVDEDAAGGTALTDPYSTTKAEAEAVVLDAVGAGGIDAVVATVVNVYGPSPRGPLSYNQLLAAAARGAVGDIVDTRVGWVLAEDVAVGQLLVHDQRGDGPSPRPVRGDRLVPGGARHLLRGGRQPAPGPCAPRGLRAAGGRAALRRPVGGLRPDRGLPGA